MERHEFRWYSPNVGREMPVVRYGDFGKPLVLMPTAGGDHLDNERFLLLQVLQPLIDAKRLKVYACGSVSGETWCDSEAAPWHKSWLQARYDDYLVHELLPAIKNDCGGYGPFAVAGASLGAYNAVTVAAKHPEWFDLVVAMSGTYEFDRWMGNHRDDNYYFNQPNYFLPNLGPSEQLDGIRKVRFVIASGTGDHEAPGESARLAALLEHKGARIDLELWDSSWRHDWVTWRAMLPLFLDKLVE